MLKKEPYDGSKFWEDIEKTMLKNQAPVKEWTYLYEVNFRER